MNKIQIISINVLNSRYKFLFIFTIYFLIYILFYFDKALALCMNEATLPTIAEAKPVRPRVSSNLNVDTFIARQVAQYTGSAKLIEEQKEIFNLLAHKNEALAKEFYHLEQDMNERLAILEGKKGNNSRIRDREIAKIVTNFKDFKRHYLSFIDRENPKDLYSALKNEMNGRSEAVSIVNSSSSEFSVSEDSSSSFIVNDSSSISEEVASGSCDSGESFDYAKHDAYRNTDMDNLRRFRR